MENIKKKNITKNKILNYIFKYLENKQKETILKNIDNEKDIIEKKEKKYLENIIYKSNHFDYEKIKFKLNKMSLDINNDKIKNLKVNLMNDYNYDLANKVNQFKRKNENNGIIINNNFKPFITNQEPLIKNFEIHNIIKEKELLEIKQSIQNNGNNPNIFVINQNCEECNNLISINKIFDYIN